MRRRIRALTHVLLGDPGSHFREVLAPHRVLSIPPAYAHSYIVNALNERRESGGRC